MIDNYKDKLKSTLSEKRYKHSLGVCDEAVKLAEKYGADTEKAYIAGILHDCAKGYDTDEQIELCQKYGVVLDDITLACKPVIHAPLGAKIAKTEYGVNDKDVLDAIMCHTVAKENMSLLDKIIYMSLCVILTEWRSLGKRRTKILTGHLFLDLNKALYLMHRKIK